MVLRALRRGTIQVVQGSLFAPCIQKRGFFLFFSLFHVKRSRFYVIHGDVLPNNRFSDRRAFSRKVFIETAYANCLRKLFVQLIGVQRLSKFLALFLLSDVS